MNRSLQPASSEAIRKASKATAVLQAFVVALLLGLVAIFIVIANRYSTLQDGIRENALWSIYQLDREARKLHEIIHLSDIEGDHSLATMKLVSTRYDILYSRLSILEQGTFDRTFGGDHDAGPKISSIRALILGFAPTFDRFNESGEIDPETLRQVDNALEPLLSETESLLIYANNAVSSDRADARTALLSLQLKSAALVVLLVVCVVFLVWSLRRQLSSVRAAGLDLESMAGDLNRSYLAAEAGNRAKSQFMATMGHEIRTPLNAILGTTELLQITDPEPSIARGLATIRRSGESLLEMINEILDYAKLDHGKLSIELRPTLVEETVLSVVDMLKDRALEHANDIRVSLPQNPRLPVIESDPTRVRQLLLNLISNAIKFTADGLITVTVSETNGPSGDRLRFEIGDNGIGIDDEGVAKLFQPFTQVDATISRKYGGTGLGLAICKEIVQHLGGTIGVESAKGIGSNFWFELPAVAATRPPGEESRPPVTGTALPSLRILLVEDNRINQEVAAEFLRHLDQHVTLANDGVQAVELARSRDFDLILMDMQMPNMDGIEATRLIRNLQGGRGKVTVVAMTANASEEDRKLCAEAGMDDFQSKPVSMSKLRDTIRCWGNTQPHPEPTVAEEPEAEFEERRREIMQVLGEDGFTELMTSFFKDADGLIAELRLSMDGTDLKGRDRLLHTMKGAASSMGLQELANSCQTLRQRDLTPESVVTLERMINDYKNRLAA